MDEVRGWVDGGGGGSRGQEGVGVVGLGLLPGT